MDQFNKFTASLNPLAQRMSKNIGQMRQFANERLGSAEDITTLPTEYTDLEARVDALRNVHQNLLKIARVYGTETYDYPTQIQESVVELSKSISDRVTSLTTQATQGTSLPSPTPTASAPVPPKTLAHAMSRAALSGTEQLGSDDPLGAALLKYAESQRKLGEARLAQDREITTKFVNAFNTTLNTSIQFATKARRNVNQQRLGLDAAKSAFKTARPERAEAARLEVEQAEDQFVAAVEEATTLMKNVLDNPEPLQNLADLVSAQAAFYKKAQEILEEVAPEIDEITVTHQAMWRNSRNE